MRTRVKAWLLGVVVVCLAAASGYAQDQPTASEPPLGNIARQIKAQKSKEPKPVKVLTNDTIGASEDKPAGTESPKKNPTETAPVTPATSGKHDAAYFREKQSKIQDEMDTHKRELSVLQQKLGQNQTQYYANPQDSMMQQYTRSDINKLTDEINAKKQQIVDDQKAMDDLRDQLRQEGGDPGWLR